MLNRIDRKNEVILSFDEWNLFLCQKYESTVGYQNNAQWVVEETVPADVLGKFLRKNILLFATKCA